MEKWLTKLIEWFRRQFWSQKKNRPGSIIPLPAIVPTATVIDIDGHKELQIDGNKVAAIGWYDLLVDPEYSFDYIRTELKKWNNAGVNLVRVWVLTNWEKRHLVPWTKAAGLWNINQRTDQFGMWILDQLDDSFFDRMERISDIANEEAGIKIAWVCFDGWSLRKKPDWWAVNPTRNIDPLERGLDGKRLWRQDGWESSNQTVMCRYTWEWQKDADGKLTTPAGSFYHPVQWQLVRRVAHVAEKNNDLVYLWNEMNTDRYHSDWDATAMERWVQEGVKHIHEVYPQAIIGHSTGGKQTACYAVPGISIADVHALSDIHPYQPGDVENIEPALMKLRGIAPRAAYCSNTDGAVNLAATRDTASFAREHCLRMWVLGGYPEFKAGPTGIVSGVVEGIREAR